jgi:hypothetical protein
MSSSVLRPRDATLRLLTSEPFEPMQGGHRHANTEQLGELLLGEAAGCVNSSVRQHKRWDWARECVAIRLGRPGRCSPSSFPDQPAGYVHGHGVCLGGRICATRGFGRGRERRNERANNHQEKRSTFHGMGEPQERNRRRSPPRRVRPSGPLADRTTAQNGMTNTWWCRVARTATS